MCVGHARGVPPGWDCCEWVVAEDGGLDGCDGDAVVGQGEADEQKGFEII